MMKSNIILIVLLLCNLISFGQMEVDLPDGEGKKAILFHDGTWKYKEYAAPEVIKNRIVYGSLADPSDVITKFPYRFSYELKNFQRINFEIVGHQNGIFKVKSDNGEKGFIHSFGRLDINSSYIDKRDVDEAVDEDRNLSIRGVSVSSINSSGGVDVKVDWMYLDDSKDIKYIEFTLKAYNDVGDLQSSQIGNKINAICQITGPISAMHNYKSSEWENVWYGSTITCIVLTKVKVTYMDNTTYTYVKELPKIMDNEFDNSCK